MTISFSEVTNYHDYMRFLLKKEILKCWLTTSQKYNSSFLFLEKTLVEPHLYSNTTLGLLELVCSENRLEPSWQTNSFMGVSCISLRGVWWSSTSTPSLIQASPCAGRKELPWAAHHSAGGWTRALRAHHSEHLAKTQFEHKKRLAHGEMFWNGSWLLNLHSTLSWERWFTCKYRIVLNAAEKIGMSSQLEQGWVWDWCFYLHK